MKAKIITAQLKNRVPREKHIDLPLTEAAYYMRNWIKLDQILVQI